MVDLPLQLCQQCLASPCCKQTQLSSSHTSGAATQQTWRCASHVALCEQTLDTMPCLTPRNWSRTVKKERRNQDGYWLVTVRTRGDFIVVPQWEHSRYHPDFISHSVTLFWHWAKQSPSYHVKAICQARMYTFLIRLSWLGTKLLISRTEIPRSTNSTIAPDATCRIAG